MSSIHAKCLAVSVEPGRTLICGKSKGHTDSRLPERREHYDPDADVRWPSNGRHSEPNHH